MTKMDKLRNILDTIYNTEHGMLYFYLILGAIALIFVVLIIITIVKAKKEDKNAQGHYWKCRKYDNRPYKQK